MLPSSSNKMLGNNHTAPCKTAHHVACNVRRGPAYDNMQREILHFNHNFVCPVCTLVLLLDTELSLFSLLSLELLSGSTQTAFNTKQSYATYWIRERYRQRPTVRQRAQSRLNDREVNGVHIARRPCHQINVFDHFTVYSATCIVGPHVLLTADSDQTCISN